MKMLKLSYLVLAMFCGLQVTASSKIIPVPALRAALRECKRVIKSAETTEAWKAIVDSKGYNPFAAFVVYCRQDSPNMEDRAEALRALPVIKQRLRTENLRALRLVE